VPSGAINQAGTKASAPTNRPLIKNGTSVTEMIRLSFAAQSLHIGRQLQQDGFRALFDPHVKAEEDLLLLWSAAMDKARREFQRRRAIWIFNLKVNGSRHKAFFKPTSKAPS
jgi:hypothetical protein